MRVGENCHRASNCDLKYADKASERWMLLISSSLTIGFGGEG